MTAICLNVQQILGLCFASFQVHGQNTQTYRATPLNTGSPFCCRDSKLNLPLYLRAASEFYAPKVVSGVELNEIKLPRGRYWVAETCARRTRKSIQRTGENQNDVEAACPVKDGAHERGWRFNRKVAMTVSRKARHRVMGLQDDRSPFTTTNANVVCGTQTDSLVLPMAVKLKSTTFQMVGSGVFPAVVLDPRWGLKQ